ncbi:MAG: HlyD family efflux transporter periplasmic adaptor subunit [Thiobacillaceae bacterium]|jgi:HlyD family secretion protein|nr:HlyD family efflux transporter periplasmic adaptor subunit [Thiobacillaceae bacterium]
MRRGPIGFLLAGLLVAAGIVYGFLPRPVPVDAVAARTGPLAVSVEEEGKTRVMDRYVIAAPMAGYARRIDLEVGDAVARGQVVAVLEPTRSVALDPRTRAQSDARVKAAEAALAAAGEAARAAAADARLAEQELTRAERLGQAEFLSRQAVDEARTRLERARAARQAAEHQVGVARYERDSARAALAHATALQAGAPAETLSLRAPVEARVLAVPRESEGPVQAGQPLLEIGNPDRLEVEVEVLSTSAVRIAAGTRVVLDRWGGERPLEGVVRTVEPAGYTKVSALGVEEQRVRVIVDFASPREAWQRLGDGYRVEAAFVVWEGADVLQVPASALFRQDAGWAAYRVDAGRARLAPVQVGQRSGLRAQILSGLKAGDRVIAHPDDRVRDGARVKPRDEP